MDPVISRSDGQLSSPDVDISQRIVIVVLGVQTVFLCRNGDRSVRDADRVVCLDGIRLAVDGDRTSGDLYIVLAGDPVFDRADIQRPDPVQDQIIFGEDHGVGIGVPVRLESAGHGQTVHAPCRRYEYLVRVLYIDARGTLVFNGHTVQDQLDLSSSRASTTIVVLSALPLNT